MLTYNFENRGEMSLYEYLYKCIKEDITSGRIEPGEKLPSKRAMAKNHNISVITVENAYAQLLVEGYISAVEKKGYFANQISILSKGRETENNADKEKEEIVAVKEEKKVLVNFSSNHILYDNFPFTTWSKIMRQALLDEENSFLMTPSRNGIVELRKAISKYLREFRGMNVDANQIIVGAGTEYLYSIIVQLLGRDSIIALEDPGYQKIGKVYESNGVTCRHLPMDEGGISIKALEESDANVVHISPAHHFPTGKVMPATRRHQILEWAEKKERYVIEDDYDSEFRFSGKPIPTMQSVAHKSVIYMNTFSKTLAPSIRIAYMVLPVELMNKYMTELNFYSSTVSSFEQYTLARFISDGYYERHINRMRNYYKEYRNRIIEIIKKSPVYDKVSIEEENAGLHFILKIKKVKNDKEFIEAMAEKGVKIESLSNYCYTENVDEKYEHKFIINYSAVDEEKMAKALELINEEIE